ncbi:MAG TPA: aspartate kinase, monofunctional class [Acidobacteriota bacterium]|nr:aspartate kinase, monofunctional class [Acidobacteriota bacterium]HRV08657.1 aspartate kinase, monofunctional class [Acidobacteriota bacterium]
MVGEEMKSGVLKPILVMKFGGTSVGGPEAVGRAVGIVEDQRRRVPRLVVVLSAMSGVTNQLLDSAVLAASGDQAIAARTARQLEDRHLATARNLLEDAETLSALGEEISSYCRHLRSFLEAVAVLGEATPRALDAIASFGERLSIRVFTAVLRERGIPAECVESTQLIVTDDHFQAARPDLVATRARVQDRLVPLLEEGKVAVVSGFLGATPEGVTTTLGRGGSDYSAALLASALDAGEVIIWTDVSGVMTADPRVVPEARTIPELSYRELAELAYFGAKVLHPMTVRPVVERGIDLTIRNTFQPDHPGTRLLPRNREIRQVIKAVTSICGQRLITIEGRGMLGVPGVAARAFSSVAATGTNVILISQASSEQSICFAVPSKQADTVVAALQDTFARELADREIDRVWSSDEVVIITVVGSGMRHTPGVSGRIFSALGNADVNVIAIAQGSSEVAISMVVDVADADRAVRAVHALIVEETVTAPSLR